ncbi:Exocyst complex component 6 [Galemys pyrenaicus]|uniref:Exocyst complex component 6 n=1 Tax=Galemys pyrenaicus TaxID=202257 RepID=A0A8J6AMA8_GALPY|nr:Exocyst complex component 6 [Galemys pyrenaicus]
MWETCAEVTAQFTMVPFCRLKQLRFTRNSCTQLESIASSEHKPEPTVQALIVRQDFEADLSQAGGVHGKCRGDMTHNREILSLSSAGKPGAFGAMLEEDPDQTYENVLAEIQSFELPIEATLRAGEGVRAGPGARRCPKSHALGAPPPAPPHSPPPLPLPRARATCRSPPSTARRRALPEPQLPAKMAESGEGLGTVPEHERILQEIESTDSACVGPTLR